MASEHSPYYIYEAGQLRTASGKPLHKKSRLQAECKLLTAPFYNSDDTRSHGNLHTAPSLLNITIQLVADNLHLVESFIDFPELIGEAIFKAALKKDKFKENLGYMNLFSDAYGANVLTEVKINDCIVLDKLFATYTGLRHVVKLDLAGCHVGDDHPVISNIAQDFVSLTHLGLADNTLTSDGVRRLCMPCKMFGRGPRLLEVLDLSQNPYLSRAAFKYLHCFKHLQLLDVSGNILMKDAVSEQEHFSAQEHKPSWYSDVCGIVGWARDVLLGCIEQYTTAANPSTIGFYGKKRKGLRQLSRNISDKSCLLLIAADTAEVKSHSSSKKVSKTMRTQQMPFTNTNTTGTAECQDNEEMHSLFKSYLMHA